MDPTVKPLEIGSIAIWPPIVLAPMSGVTNRTLRALYKPFGFGLTVTEFVSSNALGFGSKRTMEMIDQHGVEHPVSTQLWGNDPAIMARAARVVRECGADIVDINFGCPAPKVTKTEGGSACLRDLDRCEAIMRAVVEAVDCPVTMKMRLGWTEADLVYVEVARRAQAVGVKALTLHARTAKQFYRGTANWDHIAALKRAIDIPVIGNGDLGDPHDAMRKMRESGVDGVMLGRAVLGNPWIVGGLRDLMEGREARVVPGPAARLRFALHHYRTMVDEWGELRAVPQMRKHLGYYLKGFYGASELREAVMRTPTAVTTIALVEAAIERIERDDANAADDDGLRGRMSERPDLALERSLYDETVDNYKRFVNPPLARVMKLSGSPVAVCARGTTIWDHAGKAYLDFAGGYGVFTLGHSHPRVVAAVRAQLDEMSLSSKTMFDPLVGLLARAIAELAPGDLEISFFANSGAEAVEGALKLARAATHRTKIVATHDAYHGKTFGALSASGSERYKTPFGPLLADVVHVPFGDPVTLEAALEGAAAFVVEPVQGEGGVIVPPVGYLRRARELCDRAGALLIADEVQTGLGRCGMLFACERDGIVPDVLVLAKGLSGGVMPIGAYVARTPIWNAAYAKNPLVHTSTFGGSPLACAAALEALAVLRDEGLVENARVRGERLLAGARAIAAEYPSVVRDVRGLGLLVGVELRSEGYGGTIVPEMLKAGVTVAWTLNRQRVIRLEPPLIVTASEIEVALEALRAAVHVAHERLGVLAETSDP